MKTKFFLIAFFVLTLSCKDEKTFLGYFTIISKESIAPNKDHGFVNMENSIGDTLSVFVGKSEQYLNLVKGDEYRVGRSNQQLFIYEDIEEYEEGLVGYTMLLDKYKGPDYGVFRCNVVTSGQDTLYLVGISEATYYNVAPGDSVFVCRNLKRVIPKYFVE